MYFISFLYKYPKFKRLPLQGLWQNAVIPVNVTHPSNDRSTLAHEAMAIDPRKTLSTVAGTKSSAPEMLCFLPDADIERCVFQEDNTQKTVAWETNPFSTVVIDTELVNSSATLSSSSSEGFDSGDSDTTLNDFESYARFENEDVLLSSVRTPKKLMLRRRLPSVKKQKYDYVQSKIKQYIKSKATDE